MTAVVPGTDAASEGVVAGEALVIGVDSTPVESFRDFCNAVEDRDGESVSFEILEPTGVRVLDLEL